MKNLLHFSSKEGLIITVNPDQIILKVNHKEKKAEISIGYKDYEISVQDAFNIIFAMQKDCYFVCNRQVDAETAQNIFQECVKNEIPTPLYAVQLSENQFIQLQKKVKSLFVFTLQYLGFDSNKCDMTFAQEIFDKMKAFRSCNRSPITELQLGLDPQKKSIKEEQPNLCST